MIGRQDDEVYRTNSTEAKKFSFIVGILYLRRPGIINIIIKVTKYLFRAARSARD